MSFETTLRKLIERIMSQSLPIFITEGEVSAVDKTSNTCTVKRADKPDLLKVRLNAILEAGNDVITVYPKNGSKVICAMVENDPTDAFILSTTNIDEIIINGGNNGGLTITPTLVENLNKTAQLLGALLNVINGAPIPEPGNGSASALQTALADALTGQSLGSFNEIENEKIKH
jgi:hypothetical protein